MDLRFFDNSTVSIESKLYGRYNANNILAAACIGNQFGVSAEKIKIAIENYKPENNRSEIKDTGHNLLILDAYNANPSSMEAALTMFAESGYTDKTLILGDMLELGEEADREHQNILSLVDRLRFQHVYLVGPVFTRVNTKRENVCFQDADLAKMWIEHHKIENSTVLIKGSRGIRLEKLVDTL
jgi:UDP-N-acetylmuramoyl-tripeptide--D-alanyl-D-alanine ligase